MAVKALTTSFRLSRATNLIQGSVANASWCIWFRPDTDADADYQTVIALEAGAAFQGVFTDGVNNNYELQTNNGGGIHLSTGKLMTAGQWYPVWYRKSGNSHNFYVSGTFIGSTTDDMSAITWLNLFLGDDGGGKNRGTFKDYREWNALLSTTELNLESNSPDPVRTANLVTNTSLVSNFLDSTSNHNNWIPTGVVNVDYQFVADDPIPAVGTTSINPLVASALPFNATINTKPSNVEFYFDYWISYTPKASEVVIGSWAFTSLVAVNKPVSTFFVGPRTAPVRLNTTIDINDAVTPNLPFSVPVTVGVESLIKLTNFGTPALAGAVAVVYSLLPGPKLASVPGNLLVWDETFGFPLVVLKKEDGTVLNHYNFSAGEAGDIQVDGAILADAVDFSGSPIGLQLWKPDLTLDQTIPYPVSFHGGVFSIRKSYLGGWFVSTKGDGVNGNVKKVNADGSFVATVWAPPYNNTHVVGIAPSPDDTILYYAITGVAGNAVKRWDLVGNVALTDLVAGIANYQIQQDILVLADGTILVQYAKISAPRDNLVKHYAADGTVLNTYNFGTGILINRGNRGLDNLTSFWVWIYNEPVVTINTYQEIKVSDGSILNNWPKTEYVRGIYADAATATPTDRFGPSFSCPFMVSPVSLTPATLLGGIYKIVPGKRNDTLWQTFSPETTLDVKIPDPLARTALLGG